MSRSNPWRSQIDNALAVLGATPSNDVRAVRQTFELLKTTLADLRASIEELEAQLDVVTSPERDAAKEVLALEKQVQDATARMARLEQELSQTKAALEAEQQIRKAERARIAELEKIAKEFEQLMSPDRGSFGRYLEKAFDEDEKKRRGRPPRH